MGRDLWIARSRLDAEQFPSFHVIILQRLSRTAHGGAKLVVLSSDDLRLCSG